MVLSFVRAKFLSALNIARVKEKLPCQKGSSILVKWIGLAWTSSAENLHQAIFADYHSP